MVHTLKDAMHQFGARVVETFVEFGGLMFENVIDKIVGGRLMLIKSVNGETELLILQSGSLIERINGFEESVVSLLIFLFLFIQSVDLRILNDGGLTGNLS